jgi:hypothetical protein
MRPDTAVIRNASRDPAYWTAFKRRFWHKIRVAGSCWEWTGSHDSLGYGHVSVAGKMRKAHRVSFYIANGYLLDGLTIDHLCRNRGCVRPDHLELVTHTENMRRSESFSGKNHKKTHCPRGHEYDAKNKRGARICRQCDNKRYLEWNLAHRRATR